MTEATQPTVDGGIARSPDGTILDQSQSSTTSATTTSQTTSPPPTSTTSTTTSSTTSGATPDDGKSLLNKDPEKKPEATGAPEKYEDFKVPDGFTLDEKVLGEATPMFKAAGLSQEAAQQFVDFFVAKTQETFEQPFRTYKDMRDGWVNEVKADPEIGGKLDQVKTEIARALDGLGDAKLANEFRAAMDITGVGDHPAFVKAFYRFALLLNEGKPTAGKGPSPLGQVAPGASARPSAAQALYPNNPSAGA